MRKILVIVLMFICYINYAQTHLEFISEPADSMALINKNDIDIINNVFNERNTLDSLFKIDEQIIFNLEQDGVLKDSIILKQIKTIENDQMIKEQLQSENVRMFETYNKELKREKNKTISFQTLTGAGIIAIILLILL